MLDVNAKCNARCNTGYNAGVIMPSIILGVILECNIGMLNIENMCNVNDKYWMDVECNVKILDVILNDINWDVMPETDWLLSLSVYCLIDLPRVLDDLIIWVLGIDGSMI